jgi:hypothetical protein
MVIALKKKSGSRRSHAVAVACAALFATSSASADDGARADVAFQEGRTALARGNLIDACARFDESDRLEPSGRAVLNLADCLERRGLTAGAHAKFIEAAQRALRANRLDAEHHARDRAARLEPKLGRIVIVVPKESEVPGLEIRRDGSPLAPALWNVAELTDPGATHSYEATAPGHGPWTTTLTTSEGRVARAELRWPDNGVLPPLHPAAAPVSTPPARSETVSTSSTFAPRDPSRALAYGALGIGGAALVFGAVAGVKVLASKSTVDERCNAVSRRCDPEGLDAASAGRTWAVLSPVALAVGVLGTSVGAYLLVRSSGDRRGAVAVHPLVTGGGGGLMLGGTL